MKSKCSILVVDDEWFIRNGIASFDWTSSGCEVVASAEDGDEALELVGALHPDIVITDIKMPGMTGLEFLEKAKAIQPNLEAVILTGYDDFDFARSAIRIGVTNYLLKPTDFDELKNTVTRLADKIRLESVDKEYQNYLKTTVRQSEQIISQHIVRSYFEGKTNQIMLTLRETYAQNSFCGIFGYLDESEKVIQDSGFEPDLLTFAIINICAEEFRKYSIQVMSDGYLNEFRFMLILSESTSDQEAYTRLLQKSASRIQQAVERYLQGHIFFGIGNIYRADELENCNHSRYEILWEKHLFYSNENIILGKEENKRLSVPESGKSERNEHFHDEKEMIQQISSALQKGDKSSASAMLAELFTLAKHTQMNPERLKLCLITIFSRFIQETGTMDYDQNMRKDEMDHISDLNEAGRLVTLEQKAYQMIDLLCNKPGYSEMEFAEKAVRYVNDHFSEDISLESLAESFHMSSSYLSKLIKMKTGHGFSTILLETRMNQAKKMMRSGKYKIYEIAQRCGFNDNSYFASVFKKQTGMTPKRYADTHKEK